MQRHVKNGVQFKDQAVVGYTEGSVQQWGRNNLLDYPTKLQIIVNATDATIIRYVVQTLLAHMRRRNHADPYSTTQLVKIVQAIPWKRHYERNFRNSYPEVFNDPKTVTLVKELVNNPFASS